MNDRKIEEKLAGGIRNMKPDMLDSLMSEIYGAGGAEPEVPRSKRSFKYVYRAAIGLAAVLLLFFAGTQLAEKPAETFAVVGLDVNPGIELSLDKDERVISADAVNDDGIKILDEMDLRGSDIKVACNALIGSMLTKGYLSRESNSILVTVRAVDKKEGEKLEKELSDNLNSFLENSEIAAAIVGQYVNDDSDLKAFADEHGISVGKAWLIQELLASGSKHMDEESLLKLSTQELILLSQKKAGKRSNSYGKADTSKYIGKKKAIKIALTAAGTDRSSVSGLKAEFDCQDGRIIYEVEFTLGGQRYDYDIDALTGDIISPKPSQSSGFTCYRGSAPKKKKSHSRHRVRHSSTDEQAEVDTGDGTDAESEQDPSSGEQSPSGGSDQSPSGGGGENSSGVGGQNNSGSEQNPADSGEQSGDDK